MHKLIRRSAIYFGLTAFSVLFLIPILAFAQEVVEVPLQDSIALLIQSLGGDKGLSILGIVAALVQIAMYLLNKTPLGNLAGKFKLLVVYGLSVVGGVTALMLSGADLLGALVHANTLAAAQVFAHQIIKNFFEKKE